MKHQIKYSTTKISPAKMRSSSGKALLTSPRLRSKNLSLSDCFTHCFFNLLSDIYCFTFHTCCLPCQKLLQTTRAEIERVAHMCIIKQALVLNRLHTANFWLFDGSQDRNGSDHLNLLMVINMVIALRINPLCTHSSCHQILKTFSQIN